MNSPIPIDDGEPVMYSKLGELIGDRKLEHSRIHDWILPVPFQSAHRLGIVPSTPTTCTPMGGFTRRRGAFRSTFDEQRLSHAYILRTGKPHHIDLCALILDGSIDLKRSKRRGILHKLDIPLDLRHQRKCD